MKATIDFNLPDDALEYKHAFHGKRYARAISIAKDYIRHQIKYNDELSDKEIKLLEDIRQLLYIEEDDE